MIDNNKYNDLLENGLILDHYLVLCNIKEGKEHPPHMRIKGFINLLTKRGYLSEGELTEKGEELLQNILAVGAAKKLRNTETNFVTWCYTLHKKCQDKLIELTGKKQVTDKINGKSYSFLCNEIDLAKVLHRAFIKYKIKDYDGVEECVIKYIEKCSNAKSWFPILQYYIMKDDMSRLYTDLISDEQHDTNPKSQQKFL